MEETPPPCRVAAYRHISTTPCGGGIGPGSLRVHRQLAADGNGPGHHDATGTGQGTGRRQWLSRFAVVPNQPRRAQAAAQSDCAIPVTIVPSTCLADTRCLQDRQRTGKPEMERGRGQGAGRKLWLSRFASAAKHLNQTDLRSGTKAMPSFFCHGLGVTNKARLARIARRSIAKPPASPQTAGYQAQPPRRETHDTNWAAPRLRPVTMLLLSTKGPRQTSVTVAYP